MDRRFRTLLLLCFFGAAFLLLAPIRIEAADLTLSMKEAIEIALSPEGNLQLLMGREAINQAAAGSDKARAALLPHLGASIGERKQTVNLEALGLRAGPTFRPPKLVGPFTTFDSRATLSQNILDLSSLRRFRAAQAGVEAAEKQQLGLQDQVAAATARAYLLALLARAQLETAEDSVVLAESLAELAEHQKKVGTGTGIDVTRSQVQLANELQIRLVARNDYRRRRLQLLRVLGLDLKQELELSDRLSFVPVDVVGPEAAFEVALQNRDDLAAQLERERSAQLDWEASRLERLPKLRGFADYGSIGPGYADAIPTWAVGVSVELPVFDGGIMEADRREQLSALRMEQLRTRDLKENVHLQVRLAYGALKLAEEGVKVAEQGLELAGEELEKAQRRYRAGVAVNLEVTDAQNRFKRAEENQISALYDYNLVRVELLEAMGVLGKDSFQ